ncbi:MAG: hypothetical protein ABJP34_03465 [Erythrobacter sp.]
MKLAKGPRPLSIWAYAALSLLMAAWWLVFALIDPSPDSGLIGLATGDVLPSRDSAIIGAAARFTIMLLPVALIWFYALNFARFMTIVVTVIWAVGSTSMLADVLSISALAVYVIISVSPRMLIAGLLVTPNANRWFRQEEADVETVFE